MSDPYTFSRLKYLLYFRDLLQIKIEDDEMLYVSDIDKLIDDILTSVMPRMVEIFKLASNDKWIYRNVREFSDHLRLDPIYLTQTSVTTVSNLIDINDDNFDKYNEYNTICQFYTDYADYLFSEDEVDDAGVIIHNQLEIYGAAVSYAYNFIPRYCKTYPNLKQNINKLIKLFDHCYWAWMYPGLIALDPDALIHVGIFNKYDLYISLKTIPLIRPDIAKEQFKYLIDLCVNIDESKIDKSGLYFDLNDYKIELISALYKQTLRYNIRYECKLPITIKVIGPIIDQYNNIKDNPKQNLETEVLNSK